MANFALQLTDPPGIKRRQIGAAPPGTGKCRLLFGAPLAPPAFQ